LVFKLLFAKIEHRMESFYSTIKEKFLFQINWLKIKLNSRIEPKFAFLVLGVSLIIFLFTIGYFYQLTLREMAWEAPPPLQKLASYEQVFVSLTRGTVKNVSDRSFIADTKNGEIEVYINANTFFFNLAGEKISSQPNFSFKDYLKTGQKVKIIYAKYDIYLASEVWIE